MLFDQRNDSVGCPSDQVAQQWRDTLLCDDLDGGPRRMRFRGTLWLPQEPKEEDADYQRRLERSALYPGLTDALDRAVSKPFSRKVVVKDLPPGMDDAWLQNVDGEGNDLTQFTRNWMRAAIKHGQAHCWVDYTPMAKPDGTPPTRADELSKKPRPFLRLIEKSNILGWDTVTLPDGSQGLSELRFREIKSTGSGYRKDKREYVRVLRLDSYEVWENESYQPPTWSVRNPGSEFYDWQEDRRASWKLVESGPFGPTGGFTKLPIQTLYTGYRAFMVSRPAFIDLAEINLTHWQSASDQRNILHVARVPMLFAQGFGEDEVKKGIVAGAGVLVSSREPGAQLSYVEHSGAAIEAGRVDLDQLEKLMQGMGSRPMTERSGDITATQVAVAESGTTTDIQCWIAAQEAALKGAFVIAGQWLGIPAEAVERCSVDIFSDFAVVLKGNEDLKDLRAMRDAGDLDAETYLREVKRRGLLADDVDLEEIIKKTHGEPKPAQTDATTLGPDGKSVPDTGAANGDGKVQDTALNGAQVTALQEVVQAVADGRLPKDAATVLILNAFPAFDQSEAERMLASADAFEPAGDEPVAGAAPEYDDETKGKPGAMPGKPMMQMQETK